MNTKFKKGMHNMFDIEKRLEKLEKSNRKMKSIAIVATLACVGVMTIAATPRGGNGWFTNLHVTDTLTIEPGGSQYIESGTLNLNEGTMNLHKGTMNFNYGNLNLNGSSQYIDGGTLNLYSGQLNLNGSSQDIYQGNLNIYGGFLDITEGGIYIDGENLSDELIDLQVQINMLQKELMECCGAVATCPSDINDDETVGVDDLLTLIGDWGDCS